jgi:hypothetical protein
MNDESVTNDEKIAGGQQPPDRRLLTAGYSLIRDHSDFVILSTFVIGNSSFWVRRNAQVG